MKILSIGLVGVISTFWVLPFSQAQQTTSGEVSLSIGDLQAFTDSAKPPTDNRTNRSILEAYRATDAQHQEQLKAQFSDQILALLDAPVAQNENWAEHGSIRNRACFLAGLFKVESAIPSLIRLLKPLNGEKVRSGRHDSLKEPYLEGFTIDGGAVYALIVMGKPAVAPLQVALKESNDVTHDMSEDHRGQQAHAKVDAEAYHSELRKQAYIRYILQEIDAKDPL